ALLNECTGSGVDLKPMRDGYIDTIAPIMKRRQREPDGPAAKDRVADSHIAGINGRPASTLRRFGREPVRIRRHYTPRDSRCRQRIRQRPQRERVLGWAGRTGIERVDEILNLWRSERVTWLDGK